MRRSADLCDKGTITNLKLIKRATHFLITNGLTIKQRTKLIRRRDQSGIIMTNRMFSSESALITQPKEVER